MARARDSTIDSISAGVGAVLAAVNVVAGLSSMAAGGMVRRFGAVETMVYTHLPSNLLLMLVPLQVPMLPVLEQVQILERLLVLLQLGQMEC